MARHTAPAALYAVLLICALSHRLDAQLVTLQEWGGRGSGPGEFDCPFFVAVGSTGQVYVSDYYNNRIQRFAPDGQYLGEWGAPGSGPGQLSQPFGIASGPDGSIYVADAGNGRIQRFDAFGNYVLSWPVVCGGTAAFPIGIAVSQSGIVHVAPSSGWPICAFTSEGVPIDSWAAPSDSTCDSGSCVWGLGIGPSGAVYLVDRCCKKIRKYSSSGEPTISWNAYQNSPAPTVGLWTAAISSAERVYVTSENNASLIEFNSDGSFATEYTPVAMSTGYPIGPTGVAIGADDGIVVSYCGNDLVQQLGYGPVQVHSLTWGRVKTIYR